MLSFFSPLESFLEYVFLFLYQFSHNYGYAIVLLSVFISLLLLPVYMIAERLQKKELLQRQSMQAKLDEIKQSFQGQERFMMIQSLYRLHKYHPVMGLRSIGSLLIQIPFFFAVYHMLRDFTALEGMSFLFIEDLSKADALLPFGRYRINVLPFIMTAINIMAANVYTRRVDPKSLVSAWNMALIFFVLLYAMPSGLVLYWTCNNVFTLLKNIVLAHRLQQNVQQNDSIKQESTYHIIRQKITSFIENDKKVVSTIVIAWIFAGYICLSFVLIPEGHLRLAVPNTILGIAITILVVSACILLLSYCKNTKSKRKKNIMGMLFCISMSIGLLLLFYYMYIPDEDITRSVYIIKLVSLALLVSMNGVLFPYFVSLAVFTTKKKQGASVKRIYQRKQKWAIYTLLVLSITVALLICIQLPAELYRSSPDDVRILFTDIVKNTIWIMLGMIVAPVLLYMIAPQRIKRQVAFICILVLGLLLLYSVFVPFDMGKMDHFILFFPERLTLTVFMYIAEGIALTVFILVLYRVVMEKIGIISIVATLCLGLVLVRIIDFSRWYMGRENTSIVLQGKDEESNTTIAETFPSQLLSFSKEKRNIIVILLDMANGGLVQRVLEQVPQLAEMYRGFTWYPNTLSIGNNTTASKPSMMGGWQFTPENIVAIEGKNVAQKFTAAHDTMIDTFQSYKYQVGYFALSFYGKEQNEGCAGVRKKKVTCLEKNEIIESYQNPWLERHPEQKQLYDSVISRSTALVAKTTREKTSLFLLASLLRSVPITFRRMIYDDEKWHGLLQKSYRDAYFSTLRDWSFVDSLSYLSNIRDEQQVKAQEQHGTFTFLHTNITHSPYSLGPDCKVLYYETPDAKDGGIYDALKCTLMSLGTWFRWMKENDIYDNTKIILVSDHSTTGQSDPMNINNVAPISFGRKGEDVFFLLHALLMVKDIGATDSLSIDNRFMSNADTASIAFHGIEDFSRPNTIIPDPTQGQQEGRELVSYITPLLGWEEMLRTKNSFPIKDKYIVTDTMFEQKNWKKVK